MNNDWILEFFEYYTEDVAMDGILNENYDMFSILDEFMDNDIAMRYVVVEMFNMTEALNLTALRNNDVVKNLLSRKDQLLKTAKDWFERQMVAFNNKKAQWLKAANDKVKVTNNSGGSTGVVDYTEKKISSMRDGIMRNYESMKQRATDTFKKDSMKTTDNMAMKGMNENVSKIFIENVLYGV